MRPRTTAAILRRGRPILNSGLTRRRHVPIRLLRAPTRRLAGATLPREATTTRRPVVTPLRAAAIAAVVGLTGAVVADPVQVVALVVAADPEAAVVVDRMAVAVPTVVTKLFIL